MADIRSGEGRRVRTAMSAGALALVLGSGIPAAGSVDTARASAVTQVNDCDHGGLLGTVTGGICRTVDNVVSSLTGDTSPLSSSPADDDTVATTAQTPADTKRATQAPDTSATDAPPTTGEETPSGDVPRPGDPADACRSAAASPKCPDPSASSLPQGTALSTPSPSPSRDHDHEPARKEPVPTGRTRKPSQSPYPEADTPATDAGAPVASEPSPVVPSPVVDAEAPRVELLWPAPLIQELQRQMSNERPVTPSRSSDTVGTVLTTALLILAILAVRLLYSRRKVKESIPFEPVPPSHHRVA